MQEKKKPVFVVATANDVARLPPELLRRGRFDEIFFLDLPTAPERAEIFAVHLRKRGRAPESYDLDPLAAASAGYVWAEIEQAVVDAMYRAFNDPAAQGREFTTEDVLFALERMIPLSRSQRESITFLREWLREGRRSPRRARPPRWNAARMTSMPGAGNDLTDFLVAARTNDPRVVNAFVASFPSEVTQCPVWRLADVINAPTPESVPRSLEPRRIGKESCRYLVSSPACGGDKDCAVKRALACARGFGPAFLVEWNVRRARIEVDPVWWLTHYQYSDRDNPFMTPGYYHPMSYYGNLPGAAYAAVERARRAASTSTASTTRIAN